MKKAATGTGLKLPDHRRSSNRSKRREKARKATVSLTSHDPDGIEYRDAVRLDFLEGAMVVDDEEVEEEYDELEDIEESGGGKKRKRSTGKRKKKALVGAIPKRFKARSLAAVLIEESSRGDGGVAEKYLKAEARPMKGNPRYPSMKLCVVTGLEGVYTDPKSGVPYANLQALEQIRERVPPWMSGSQGGSSAYHDAVKSLRNEK